MKAAFLTSDKISLDMVLRASTRMSISCQFGLWIWIRICRFQKNEMWTKIFFSFGVINGLHYKPGFLKAIFAQCVQHHMLQVLLKDDSQFQWPLLPKMIWETDKYQIEKQKREVTMVPEQSKPKHLSYVTECQSIVEYTAHKLLSCSRIDQDFPVSLSALSALYMSSFCSVLRQYSMYF